MTKKRKIAVAIVHGVGKQEHGFAEPMVALLWKYFAREMGDEVAREWRDHGVLC